jgi:hypothetical protein
MDKLLAVGKFQPLYMLDNGLVVRRVAVQSPTETRLLRLFSVEVSL